MIELDISSRAISQAEENGVWGVRRASENERGADCVSCCWNTQEQNGEVPIESGNMEVICGHNPRVALAEILRIEARLE